eukprot:353069-Chlamydomonas_euryale.AAC.36
MHSWADGCTVDVRKRLRSCVKQSVCAWASLTHASASSLASALIDGAKCMFSALLCGAPRHTTANGRPCGGDRANGRPCSGDRAGGRPCGGDKAGGRPCGGDRAGGRPCGSDRLGGGGAAMRGLEPSVLPHSHSY